MNALRSTITYWPESKDCGQIDLRTQPVQSLNLILEAVKIDQQ